MRPATCKESRSATTIQGALNECAKPNRVCFYEIGEERRTGYLWYTDEPATTLRRYERWLRRRG
jgi:hypothetical protein